MNPALEDLIRQLSLERLEDDLFRGSSRNIGTKQVYGGQVLGQALKAAQYTVEDRHVHSLHAYFLRKGNYEHPIIYRVENNRDGKSFSSRRVTAIQHGRPIFILSASFQILEKGLEYQEQMPVVPKPDKLVDIYTNAKKQYAASSIKFKWAKNIAAPFELMPIEPLKRLRI